MTIDQEITIKIVKLAKRVLELNSDIVTKFAMRRGIFYFENSSGNSLNDKEEKELLGYDDLYFFTLDWFHMLKSNKKPINIYLNMDNDNLPY